MKTRMSRSETESQSTDDQENEEEQEEENCVNDEDGDDEDDKDDEEDEEEGESMDEELDYDELEHYKSHVCQEPRQFSKIFIVRCPTCYWHEGHYSMNMNEGVRCDVCTSVFPANQQNTKKTFYCCNDCDSIHRMSLKSKKLRLLVTRQESEEMDEMATHEENYFPFLANWEHY
ncbi:tripartite motif-containing protein 44-like [Actinia tenebrosa]|uniref:Tripartite motif-containing protein 44-like n=1 Tax=Actinia tenebrosa TaxID=6105 RepID=A0A6P8IHV3_ACTTE|nr:tripartite motif-containing protein 44-like [Actinia tenebrosa]